MAASARRILVVDDELQILTFLTDLFRSEGWDIQTASSGTAGIERIERDRYDVILTDLKMPGADGLEVLRTAKKIQSDAEVILMTAFGSVDSAIEAMREGAFHFLMKPFRAEEVLHLVAKAYDRRQLRRENLFLKAESRGEHRLQSVVGAGAAVLEMIAAIQRISDTDTPALFTGERGTGRGFLARIVHFQSSRSAGLFVPVHCAGSPEDLLESDLFGHAAGAYDRAVLPRAGKMELANRGTLFLAEVGEAGARIQARLLRLLDTRTISPVGTDDETELDIRLLASTVRDLDELVARGTFLGGLRDHLSPWTVRVPPLRERAEDIPLLLHHFLYEENRNRKKPLRGFSEAAVSALSAYAWPGNMKELRDFVRSVSSRKKQGTVVDAADLPFEILYGRKRRKTAEEPPPLSVLPDIRAAIEDLEKPLVLQALALAEGNTATAAGLLHIEVAALEELMRRHGIA